MLNIFSNQSMNGSNELPCTSAAAILKILGCGINFNRKNIFLVEEWGSVINYVIITVR